MYDTLHIARIFSSSEPVEPHINPFKVRLAVALKEEANDRYLWETVSIESCCFTAFEYCTGRTPVILCN